MSVPRRWRHRDQVANVGSVIDCTLVAMGVSIFDNLDFERAVEHARQLTRYEFLFSAAPLRIALGTGSPLNPLAIF